MSTCFGCPEVNTDRKVGIPIKCKMTGQRLTRDLTMPSWCPKTKSEYWILECPKCKGEGRDKSIPPISALNSGPDAGLHPLCKDCEGSGSVHIAEGPAKLTRPQVAFLMGYLGVTLEQLMEGTYRYAGKPIKTVPAPKTYTE